MNIDEMIEEVCLKYRVGQRNIFSNSRRKEATTARKVIYKVLMLYGKSTTQIGKFMNRDHSSIVVGIRSVDRDEELSKYATYIYLKYRDTEEISHRVDVRTAKKVIFDEVKYFLNDGLSPKSISMQLELPVRVVSSIATQIHQDCIQKKIPDYRTGTYRNIYI